MTDGDRIPTIVGYEFDWVHDNGLTPPGLVVLSRSPVCNHHGFCDLISNSTIYQSSSGGWVFAAGTIWWGWGLDRFGIGCGSGCPNIPDARLQRITANILGRFQGLQAVLAVSRTTLEYAASPGLVPPAQTFQIANTGSGALDWTAQVVGGDWLSLEPTTGLAPSTVSVAVNPASLPAGVHRAAIRVDALPGANATNSPKMIEVSLRINPPSINANGIVNGASLAPQAPVSPGSIVSLFGVGLAPATATAAQLPLPTSLDSTEVLVNGMPAPLFFVSPLQINFQMPWEITGDTAAITVRTAGLTSAITTVLLASEAPGIFLVTFISPTAGAVLNQDGTLNAPLNPAQPGSVISIFATGLGPVNPAVLSGQPGATAEPLNRTVAPISVLINGEPVEVLFAGLAPGFVGLYQVNARVPQSISAGTEVNLQLQIGGQESNTVTIAVQ